MKNTNCHLTSSGGVVVYQCPNVDKNNRVLEGVMMQLSMPSAVGDVIVNVRKGAARCAGCGNANMATFLQSVDGGVRDDGVNVQVFAIDSVLQDGLSVSPGVVSTGAVSDKIAAIIGDPKFKKREADKLDLIKRFGT